MIVNHPCSGAQIAKNMALFVLYNHFVSHSDKVEGQNIGANILLEKYSLNVQL